MTKIQFFSLFEKLVDFIHSDDIMQIFNIFSRELEWNIYVDFTNFTCSKFVSDIVMSVSSSMALRDRSSESARFEILSAEHR